MNESLLERNRPTLNVFVAANVVLIYLVIVGFSPDTNIAPTWVHYDVRCYEPKYLKDEFFCRNLRQLDNRKRIRI